MKYFSAIKKSPHTATHCRSSGSGCNQNDHQKNNRRGAFQRATLSGLSLLFLSPMAIQVNGQDEASVARRISNIEIAEAARQGQHQQVYFIGEGDTIKSIAERFSSDPNFSNELLALNQLEESELRPGRPLIIPGPERDQAIQSLERANAVMKQAVAANAARYALNDFKEAVDIYDDGSRARNSGSYIRARLLGDLAYERFQKARDMADRGALQDRGAKLTILNGKVFVSSNNGLSYRSAAAESEISAGGIVRTSPSSSARIQFDDQSSIEVRPGTTLALSRYRQDQRSGKSQRVVQLQAGEVYVEARPLSVEGSEFFLLNGMVRIGLNDATVLARTTDDGRMMQCTYKGQTPVVYQGRQVVQGIGTGSICSEQGGLEGPFPLNESVDILTPAQSGLTTATQEYTVSWRESANHDKVEYKLLISRSPDFSDLVESAVTRETSYTTRPLSAGPHYLRLELIDPLGLTGFSSETMVLNIQPNLDLLLGYGLNQLKLNGLTYVGPAAAIQAVPATTDNSIHHIMYQIDDSPYFASSEGVTLAESGSYTVRARAHGVDKQSGKISELVVTVDHTPPELRVHVGELTEIPGYGTVRTVAFIADDNTQLKAVEYSLNGDSYKAYTAPLKLPVSKSFRIEARARDYFENVSETIMSLERIKIQSPKSTGKSTGLFNRLFEHKSKKD